MRDEIEFDGIAYTAVRHASEEAGLSRDYIARLCKKGSVVGRRVGTGWYVDMRSLTAFLQAQQHAREYRRQSLVRERSDEYRANNGNGHQGRSMATSPVPFATAAISPEIHERLRHALDEKSSAGFDALSDTSNIPSGFAHAALQSMPAQALAHIPVSAITPTAEMLHKVVALATTFLIVAGVFVLVAPSQVRYAYDSISIGSIAAAAQSVHLTPGVRSSLHSVQTFLTIESSAVPNPMALLSAGGASGHVALEVLSQSAPGVPDSISSAQGSGVEPAVVQAQTAAAVSALVTQSTVVAQSGSNTNAATSAQQVSAIATEVAFTGSSVSYGDLISYEPTTGVYTLTQASNDPNEYGVVVQQPALLFRPGGTGNVPVLRSGSAPVNVTLENGPIAIGDPLTSSSIPGKARRANPGEHVVGTAAEAFTGQGGVYLRAPDGSQVLSGTILTDMDVGTSPASADPVAQCSSLACRLLSGIDPSLVRSFARYLLSGLIAALALFLAFKSFMSDANYGVISMGRNPRAKISIQSMVLLNAFLAMAIASAGLFASIVVLYAAT